MRAVVVADLITVDHGAERVGDDIAAAIALKYGHHRAISAIWSSAMVRAACTAA
jgi:hypothetical protein